MTRDEILDLFTLGNGPARVGGVLFAEPEKPASECPRCSEIELREYVNNGVLEAECTCCGHIENRGFK